MIIIKLNNIIGRPLFVALIIMFIDVFICLLSLFLGSNTQNSVFIDGANFVAPTSVIIATCFCAYKTARQYSGILFTPYLWFMIGSALYLGVGPLVYIFGNTSTLYYVNSGYIALSDYELLETNFLNALGIFTVLLIVNMLLRFKEINKIKVHNRQKKLITNLGFIGVIFLILGGIMRFVIFLPYQFKQIDINLPGVIVNLQYLFLTGLIIVIYTAVKDDNNVLKLVGYIIWPLHLVISLLEFDKFNFVISIALPAIAIYVANKNKYQLMLAALISLASIVILQPFVLYARSEIVNQTGSVHEASFAERADIAIDYVTSGFPSPPVQRTDDVMVGWTRLAYAGLQAVAMRQYDQGNAGNTIGSVWVIFVPRFIWPEKPIINLGENFYELLTGRGGTSVGITLFANGYWEYGWGGVVMVGIFLGILYTTLTRLIIVWLEKELLIYLPAIMLMISMGFEVGGFVVSTIMGTMVIVFFYVLLIKYIIRFTS